MQRPSLAGDRVASSRCAIAAASLLERSSELTDEADAHPAYARILSELSPGRGADPAPAGDRAARSPPSTSAPGAPLDVGSVVVAPGPLDDRRPRRLPAPRRGARLPLEPLPPRPDLVLARAELPDLRPYQVLEAQPDVIDALQEAGRARIVRRSIRLTPFGGPVLRVLPAARHRRVRGARASRTSARSTCLRGRRDVDGGSTGRRRWRP